MYEYKVNGMTCGSCALSIEKVIQKADPQGQVRVDLEKELVQVESNNKKDDIAGLIENAGYEVIESRSL